MLLHGLVNALVPRCDGKARLLSFEVFHTGGRAGGGHKLGVGC